MIALLIVSSWTILSVAGNDCCDCTESSYSPNCNQGCDGTICAYDPYCCQGSWDWICANSAVEECNGPAPPSGSTACCQCTESLNSANCNEECDGSICSYDPYCCNYSWDWICADAAKVECEAAGGNAEEESSESSDEGEPAEGSDAACCDCTESEQGPNCKANPACNPIVCPLDSYCCNWSWDGVCANGAQNICNSVDYWSWPEPEETGSCCDCTEESYEAGCNKVCEDEVCELDNYCCEGQWDSVCADGASNICQGYDYGYGASDDSWNDWDSFDTFGYDYSWYSPSEEYSYYEPYNFEDSYSYSYSPAPWNYNAPTWEPYSYQDSYDYTPSGPWSYEDSYDYNPSSGPWDNAPTWEPYSYDDSYSYSPGPWSYEPDSYQDSYSSTPGPWSYQSSSTWEPYNYYDSFSYNYESNYPYYYDYDEDENDDCFMSVCGEAMSTCASSPDCYDGFMAAESECEGEQYESMEHCVEQLVQGPNEPIIQFCNGNETAAGDLQALGQCFLNLDQSGACNEEEMKKIKFKTFVKAIKKVKESKKSRLTKKERAKGSKKARSKRARARSGKMQRRPRLARRQRKVRSQRRAQRGRPAATKRRLAQRQRRPRLSRRVRGRAQRRQRPQRSRRYRARLGRAMAKRRRQRQRQRPMKVQRQRSRRD